jgi:hypothetical protein
VLSSIRFLVVREVSRPPVEVEKPPVHHRRKIGAAIA